MGGTILSSGALERYVTGTMVRESALLARLREETSKLTDARMLLSADTGALLAFLVRLTNTRSAIEVGTFTGYSALCIAGALPADGTLIACDINDEWTRTGRRYWQEAGIEARIDLRLAPATDTLAALLAAGRAGTFDFAFVDADKPAYAAYYELCLQLLRPGGLIAFDNVLWSGRIVDPAEQDASTEALRALNLRVRDDARVEAMVLSVGDGILLARKR